MVWVYLLESGARRHVGIDADPVAALRRHNAGAVAATAPYSPWQMVGLFRFDDPSGAEAFAEWLRENHEISMGA